jgi:hypothetical protein
VLKALLHAFSDMPQVGWIRGDAAASSQLLEQSNRILQENADLRVEINKLRTTPDIKIENIADLDDVYLFRYRSRNYGSSSYTNRTATLSWRQIFLPLAGQLDKPRTAGIISSAFREAVKEAQITPAPSDVDDTDQVRIKVQMTALGLITTTVMQTTTGGLEEFISLTDKGRAVFVDGVVVRKTTGD